MEDILKRIVAQKRIEVAASKKEITYTDLEKSYFFEKKIASLKASIEKQDFGIIAEIKRKSPSAGTILGEMDVVEIAKNYEQTGMAGISILTDFNYFGGTNKDVQDVKEKLTIPVLRKEFIVDEFQIFESKAIGADAILLIAEILSAQEVKEFTIVAKSLGLEVIMELHDFSELDKIYHEIDILGINNRNLKTQTTLVQKSIDLAPYLPKEKLKISESGIKSRKEIEILASLDYKGALIGESILKSENRIDFLSFLNPLPC